MRRQRPAAAWLILLLLAFLTACAQLGVPPADTFAKRLAGGYASAATISQSAGALLDAKRITPERAQRVHDQVASAIVALDAAAVLARADLAAADSRLTVTIAALTALQAALAAQQQGSTP